MTGFNFLISGQSQIRPVTWSSNGSSPKAGMYLAHSTNTSNCCLIESQMSPMVAAFCSDRSTIPAGLVIWMERENWILQQVFGTHTRQKNKKAKRKLYLL